MMLNNLGLGSNLLTINLNQLSHPEGPELKRHAVKQSGFDNPPFLFVRQRDDSKSLGEFLGQTEGVRELLRSGELDKILFEKCKVKIPVKLSSINEVTLTKNIYSYPKGLLEGKLETGKIFNFDESSEEEQSLSMNVLLGCTGSTAADKILRLAEKCIDEGWNVKVVTTRSAEHFWKHHAGAELLNLLGAENIYRDEDEWNFEYEEFGMPVIACHLGLRLWADILVVAPATCNFMGKAASGIGDSLLTSIVVAWQFGRKSIIVCPACNVDMWHNAPTQRNVRMLKEIGAEIMGPGVGTLSNGKRALGVMWPVDKIVDRLRDEDEQLMSSGQRFGWLVQRVSHNQDTSLWAAILRAVVDPDVVPKDVLNSVLLTADNPEAIGSSSDGDRLLHVVCGLRMATGGDDFGAKKDFEIIHGQPNPSALKLILERRKDDIDVNVRTEQGLTPLDLAVALKNDECIALLKEFMGAEESVSSLHSLPTGMSLYFTYGSLKRNFPNYDKFADTVLSDFVGTAITNESFPLVIPKEPKCDNPNCPYLHRMASLIHSSDCPTLVKSDQFPTEAPQVHRIKGELFRVSEQGLKELDVLEGYTGVPGDDKNVYERRHVEVEVIENDSGKRTKVECWCYFMKKGAEDKILEVVEGGTSECVPEYELDMAKGELKPEFQEAVDSKPQQSKRQSIMQIRQGMSQMNNKLPAISETGTSEAHGADMLKNLLKKQGGNLLRPSPAGGSKRRSRMSFRINALTDAVTEAKEQFINPTTLPSIESNEVEFFKKNASTGLMQQPINMCNLAAVNVGLRSINVETNLDDIFEICEKQMISINDVTTAGLTLGDTFLISEALCLHYGNASVECFYLDKAVMEKIGGKTGGDGGENDEEEDEVQFRRPEVNTGRSRMSRVHGMLDVIEEQHSGKESDGYLGFMKYALLAIEDPTRTLIPNFNTKIAHQWHGRFGSRKLGAGGGHFAMLGDYNYEQDLFTMFEVHPLKYGSMWKVPSKMLFDSMVDPDGGVSRSRGFLVFTRHVSKQDAAQTRDPQYYTRTAPVPRILQNCFSLSASSLAASHQSDEYEEGTHAWLKHFVEMPRQCFALNRNNSGIGAIALAVTVFSRQYLPVPKATGYNSCVTGLNIAAYGPQYIIRLLKLPLTKLLGELQTSASIESYLRRALVEMKLDSFINLSIERFEKCRRSNGIAAGKALFKRHFKDVLMHTNVTSGNVNKTPSLIMMKVNVNTVFGASIMPQNLSSEANALDTEMQNGQMWVVVAAVDNSKETADEIDKYGENTYGDIIATSANMSRMGPFIRCKLENLCDALEDNTEMLVLRGK